MQRRLNAIAGGMAVLAIALTGCSVADGQVPTFQVNPFWPEPFEYPAILAAVSGITVAPDGNILVVSRDDTGFTGQNDTNVDNNTSFCCDYSQPVVEWTPDGSLVREWGGEGMGYPWPSEARGIALDPDGNVWIGGGVAGGGGGGGRGGRGGGAPAAAPEFDGFILKFSRTGQHLATYGTEGSGPAMSSSMSSFAGANDFAFDGDVAYVADGYGNRRVAVVDVATGAITEVFGAYGNAPSDEPLEPYDPTGTPSQQFRTVTCVELADDGLLYVCDMGNNRIQVFDTNDGNAYVTELPIAPQTLGDGSVVDIALSPDQRFIYAADNLNERVYIIERETLTILTSFGDGGRYPGHFRELGGIATDADGNVYTAEDGDGRRVQQFINTGMGVPTVEHQGAAGVWPAEDL